MIPSTPAELIERLTDDLHQTDHLIRWAHTNGHWPSNATPATRRRPTPNTSDPDRIPGARYDLGIGDHRSRAAVHTTIGLLANAEPYIILAAYAYGTDRTPRQLRPPTYTYDQALRSIAANLARLASIDPDPPTQRAQLRTALRRAARPIDQAVRTLDAALAHGDTGGVATNVARCRNHPRGCPNDRQAKTGGRCYPCARY